MNPEEKKTEEKQTLEKVKKCGLHKRFHHWLFAKGNPLTLAVLRIVFGIIAFLWFLVQYSLLEEFYSERGLLPKEYLALWQWKGPGFNPFLLFNFEQVGIFYCISLVASLCFALGYFTKISAWLTFFLLLAFNMRNPLILNSGDVLLRVVICYLALSQCGSMLSIDSLMRSRKGIPNPREIPLFPQRLIQLQIALVYLISVSHKVQGSVWLDGSAIWYVSRIEELARFPVPDFMMTLAFSRIASWGTLLIQTSLFTLVWFPKVRFFALLGGIMLHSSIEYQMNIPFFSIITMSCYLSFIEGEKLAKVFQYLSRYLPRNKDIIRQDRGKQDPQTLQQ